MKIFLKDLGVVVFREKHLADSAEQPFCMFDVLPLAIDEVEPELLFCASLLDKVLNFEKTWMKAFLEYQCKLKADLVEIKTQVKKISIPAEAFVDNAQFLKMMGVSARTAQTWRDEGKIGFSQEGKKIYYRLSDIEAFMKRSHRKPFALPQQSF